MRYALTDDEIDMRDNADHEAREQAKQAAIRKAWHQIREAGFYVDDKSRTEVVFEGGEVFIRETILVPVPL